MNSIKFLSLTVFSLMVLASNAQTTESTNENPPSGQSSSIDELPVRPFRMPSLSDVGGSPFLSEDYRKGSVDLGQGRVISGVPMKFNSFNNAILVKKNGEEVKLDFFEMATYDDIDAKGISRHYIFKSGYPEVENRTENSIYQVLSMGPKVHFLKYIAQKVEEVPTLGDYSRREIVTQEEFYVYMPKGGIKRIASLKGAKKSLQEVLPADLYARVDEISSAKGLKLKSETDLLILMEELNKP